MRRSYYITILIAMLCAAYAVRASAAPMSYSATVGGQPKQATVDAFQADNQAYVSLSKLIAQFGGSARETPGKLTADLGGRSAVVAIDGSKVNTSSATFSLKHPVKDADGGPYIAVEDLPAFFSQAFEVTLAEGAAAPPVENAPPDEEEEMGLLEDVAPAPAAPAEGAPAGEPAAAPVVPAAPDGVYLVVVDPGHGGSDPGIVSGGGSSEKDIVLAIARAVEKALEGATGVKAALTRTEDKDLSMVERVNIANQAKASLFIGVHTGGSTSPAAHGFEIFVQGAGGVKGAGVMGESQYQAEQAAKLLADRTGATSRGIREVALREYAGLNMPGILVEAGMLTTPAEESLLASVEYQQKIAGALADLVNKAAARAAESK